MTKLMLFIRKKSGISDEVFRDGYENGHAILARRTLPQLLGYKRNYIREEVLRNEDGKIIVCTGPRPFDVVTEQYFKDRASFNAAMNAFRDLETMKRIAEDEEQIFDRSTILSFLVEEYTSDFR